MRAALPDLQAHLDAIEAALVDVGVTVGIAEAPVPGRPAEHVPYTVLSPFPGGAVGGNLADATCDVTIRFTTMCVGAGAEQALWEQNRVRSVLNGRVLSVEGRRLDPINPQPSSGEVRRDNDVTPAVFYAIDLWSVRSRA